MSVFDDLLRIIAQWVAWIAERVIEYLWDTINRVWDWLGEALQSLYNWFAAVLDGLFNYMQSLITNLTTYFNTILEEISAFVARVWQAFLELTVIVIDEISAFAENVWSKIRRSIEALLETAVDWIVSVADEAVRLINVGIDAITDLAERAKNTLLKWLDEFLAKVLETYDLMLAKLNQALDAFLGPVGSFIEGIGTRLSELKIAFADAATSVVAGITETAEDTLGPIRDKIQELIKNLIPSANAAPAQAFVADAQKLADGNATPQEYRKFASDIWRKTDFKDGFWAELFFTVIGVMGGVALIAQVTTISSQVMMQDFAKQYPFQIFNPADVTQAWRRELVSQSFAEDTIQRAGYTAENAKLILKLSDQVPNEGDLLILYHRGLISDAELDKALHQRGYDEFYKTRIAKASFLIPPINDLITMAVREAFSPEVAERFGQYEDYPTEMTGWAEKQALTEEWSKRYWAAHWALPSPQQGFEMLHRGVIEQPDLDLLLRALDVMPFWRERLVKIAYTPYTRIDIRRMHKVGVLTEEDVLRSYRDLGYDADKARTMTDFVMLLNAPKSADDEDKLKELSRSSVINFYKDGLLLRDKAATLLSDMGYSPDAAELYLDSADLDEQRADRKDEIGLTLALAEASVITFEQAEDRLRNLGLETAEVNKAIIQLVRKQQRTTKLPSRSEAERMVKLGIIEMTEYQGLLRTLGYSEKWSDAYIKLSVSAG